MGDVISSVEALTYESGEHGTDYSRDSEGKEVHPARGASFYLIRIGFFDDGIGNHGCAGSDAEDKSG